MVHYQHLELIGLALLFVSLVVKLFFVNAFKQWASSYDEAGINEKMNILWKYVGSRIGGLTSDDKAPASKSYDKFSKEWDRASKMGEKPHQISQRLQKFKDVIFISGIFLTLFAKLLEYSDKAFLH